MTLPLTQAILGETNIDYRLDRVAELTEANQVIFSQATRQIDILSYDLDPRVLSQRSIEQSLKHFLKLNRHTHLRILLHEPQRLLRNDHRILSLFQTLSSFVSIHELSKDHKRKTYAYTLIDSHGYLYRKLHSDLTSFVNFHDPIKVKELRKEFDDLWEHSTPASGLRALGI